MKIQKVKVRLERRAPGPFAARVIQQTSDGEKKGENLLKNRNVYREDSAKDAVLAALHGMVDDVEFELLNPDTDQT